MPVPEPVAQGAPGEGYPYPWSVYRWLEGETATTEALVEPVRTARDLAAASSSPCGPSTPPADRGRSPATPSGACRWATTATRSPTRAGCGPRSRR
ncbi:phosphotransferase [Streptomyces rishiriensis]|uniref:phosphotransferase n=1 Tax=Streptomyces rishiriensis TaxID=68264 RepID=UPI0037B70673